LFETERADRLGNLRAESARPRLGDLHELLRDRARAGHDAVPHDEIERSACCRKKIDAGVFPKPLVLRCNRRVDECARNLVERHAAGEPPVVREHFPKRLAVAVGEHPARFRFPQQRGRNRDEMQRNPSGKNEQHNDGSGLSQSAAKSKSLTGAHICCGLFQRHARHTFCLS
jgi:hypothetical protein